ncbi:hypothetical protein ACOMHN_014671 [Nucella lapillus]
MSRNCKYQMTQPPHRSVSNPREHLQLLQATNNQLKNRVTIMGLLELLLVIVHALSMTVLNDRYPQVWTYAFRGPVVGVSRLSVAAAASRGGEVSSPRERSHQGRVPGERESGRMVATGAMGESSKTCASSSPRSWRGDFLDVETALCLLIESKVDLDGRTKRLDEEVYRNNRQLEKLMPPQARKRNVSVVYSSRPSCHLSLYYSHELRHAQNVGWKGFEPLLWTQWLSGLSSLREMDVSTTESGVITNIRVRHAGYYHVYSQVTFKSSYGQNRKPGRSIHCVYKNYGEAHKLPTRGHPLLMAYTAAISRPSADVSYLQGVFLLNAGDLLTVLAPSLLLQITTTEDTFFGAFRI